MCGGTLEIVPCSYVGHIFRKRSPHKWRSGVDVFRRNYICMAEVWLEVYYTISKANLFQPGDYVVIDASGGITVA